MQISQFWNHVTNSIDYTANSSLRASYTSALKRNYFETGEVRELTWKLKNSSSAAFMILQIWKEQQSRSVDNT